MAFGLNLAADNNLTTVWGRFGCMALRVAILNFTANHDLSAIGGGLSLLRAGLIGFAVCQGCVGEAAGRSSPRSPKVKVTSSGLAGQQSGSSAA